MIGIVIAQAKIHTEMHAVAQAEQLANSKKNAMLYRLMNNHTPN
jgi:hypothetical protein